MLANGLDWEVRSNPRELSIFDEFIKEAQMHHHEHAIRCLCWNRRINQEAARQIAHIFDSHYALLAN